MLKTILPRRVKLARELIGKSQAALARDCHIAPATMNQLEGGQCTDLKLSTLLKICLCIGCSPDYLLGFEENASSVRRLLARKPPAEPEELAPARRCEECGTVLGRGDPHPLRDCIAIAILRRGKSDSFLALRFGLPRSAILAVIQDELDFRRLPAEPSLTPRDPLDPTQL